LIPLATNYFILWKGVLPGLVTAMKVEIRDGLTILNHPLVDR